MTFDQVLPALALMAGITACSCVFWMTLEFLGRPGGRYEKPYPALSFQEPSAPLFKTTEVKVNVGPLDALDALGGGNVPITVRSDGENYYVEAPDGYVIHQTPDGLQVVLGKKPQASSSNSCQPMYAAQAKSST